MQTTAVPESIQRLVLKQMYRERLYVHMRERLAVRILVSVRATLDLAVDTRRDDNTRPVQELLSSSSTIHTCGHRKRHRQLCCARPCRSTPSYGMVAHVWTVAFFAAWTKSRVTPAPCPLMTVLFVAMIQLPVRWYALGSSWIKPPFLARESRSAVSSCSGRGACQ